MKKIVLTEVKNFRERARTKRIEELKNNIHLYKNEIKRWKQELAQLTKGEKWKTKNSNIEKSVC